MLNSISRRGWIRMHTAALLAAGMSMTAAAPPLAAQQEVVDPRLVIMNVRQTEEALELNEEQLAAMESLEKICEAYALAFLAVADRAGGRGSITGREDLNLLNGLCAFDSPESVVSHYTIFIRENRMAVHTEGLPTMVWQVIPGSHAEMYFYDPETGRIETLGQDMAGNPLEIINLQAADRLEGEYNPTEYQFIPSYEGPDGERLGYPVDKYGFVDGVSSGELARLGLPAGLLIHSVGEILIAPDTPYNGVVGRFFENFAAHVDSGSEGMLGGMTRAMALMGSAGVPMRMEDVSTVTLPTVFTAALDEGADDLVEPPLQGLVVQRTSTRSEVTDIRFGQYNVEELEGIFGPDPTSLEGNPDSPAGAEGGAGADSCDCSCAAFREFQDLDKNDPGATAKAMCARQCVMQWVSCAGPECGRP